MRSSPCLPAAVPCFPAVPGAAEREKFRAQEQGSGTGSAPGTRAPHLGDDSVKAALSPRIIPRIGVQHPAPANGTVQEFLPVPNQPLGAGLLAVTGGIWANAGFYSPGKGMLGARNS